MNMLVDIKRLGLLGGLATVALGTLIVGCSVEPPVRYVPRNPDDAVARAAGSEMGKPAFMAPPEVPPPSGPVPMNRLLKPAPPLNLPPATDGIHDPADDQLHLLQRPSEVFSPWPKDPYRAGNGVDWMKVLAQGKIKPRWELDKAGTAPPVFDLNIEFKVKGSTPDVIFPHGAHTRWLACANCHAGIFVPQKGANRISMEGIMRGQKCGVCHGSVAFPPTECARCHTRPKSDQIIEEMIRARKRVWKVYR